MNSFHYTAEWCADMATYLDECVGVLETWGIRIVGPNRLRRAADILRKIGTAGQYPPDPERLRSIGHAIRTAHDFRYIAACLPGDRLRELAVDLQRSVSGDLDERSDDRAGYQYQTQLVIGAVIAFADHAPVIPALDSPARADYYVENGTHWYGIEVKRPGSLSGARKGLKKAAQQLGSTSVHMGATVLDLTDLFRAEETMIVARGPAQAERHGLSQSLATTSLKLEEQVFDDDRRRFKTGYEHVGAYLAFVRGCVWNLDDLRYPDLFQQARFATFSPTTGHTLWWHRAQWLVEMLRAGTEATGHRVWRHDGHPHWPDRDVDWV